MSIRELARRLAVDPAYLSRMERRKVAAPRDARIRELAYALDADVNVLFAAAALDRLPSSARGAVINVTEPWPRARQAG